MNNFLWCLHGNLQSPAVWTPFESSWQVTTAGISRPLTLKCPSLWASGANSFDAWTDEFCRQVSAMSPGAKHWLMGYSLGGRLALHAVLAHPELWEGVIVTGAHPGFASAHERQLKRAWDDHWAARFLDPSNTWEDLLRAWDALPIFAGRPNPTPRAASQFSRKRIAECFRHYSKGRQRYLVPALAAMAAPPVLFLSGEHDPRYTEIGKQLASTCPAVQHAVIPGAGHRAPWENKEDFIGKTRVFLDATS